MQETLHLLIVDDDQDDKDLFTEVVSEMNVAVNCAGASNGQEALEWLKKQKILPDFIFLDLNMPRMNGKQFLQHLKKNEKLTTIPVIIYTTSRSNEDKEETKKLGAIHFITKPSSMSCLKKELEFVFSRQWENNEAV